MPRCVALFRGINVGKAKRIAMADLRALLESMGCTQVTTLLNSGNAVFTARGAGASLSARIRRAVLEKLGVDAPVIVKSQREIADIVAQNAIARASTDDSRLLVAIAQNARGLARVRALADRDWGDERLHIGTQAAYLWCADGILQSRAAVALLKDMGDTVTTRNWATLRKLHALLAAAS